MLGEKKNLHTVRIQILISQLSRPQPSCYSDHTILAVLPSALYGLSNRLDCQIKY